VTPASGTGREALVSLARCYLSALVDGRPDDVPLAAGYHATENARPVAPGEGLWKTTRAIPGHPAILCDEARGEVVVIGAIDTEGLHPLALRLRIQAGAIAEAEAIVSTNAHGFFADVDQLVNMDLIYEAPVPPERGATRTGLREAADLYWVALGESDGSLVAVNHRADRYANGKKTTNNLEILLSPDKAVHTIASIITGTRPARPKVREKRFPVQDKARGVTVSIAMVDFADDPRNPRPDTGCFYIMNLLKVVDGEIRMIDAIHQILPRGTASGWTDAS